MAKAVRLFATFLFILLILSAVFTYFYLRSKILPLESSGEPPVNAEESIKSKVPSLFPDSYSKIDEWTIESVQPVVDGFETIDGANYILFKINDIDVKGFITGSIGGVKIDAVSFRAGDNQSFKDFDYVKGFFKKGSTAGLKFISAYPQKKDRVEDYCKKVRGFCPIADLSELLKEREALADFNSDVLDPDSVLPVVEVYTNLKGK